MEPGHEDREYRGGKNDELIYKECLNGARS